MEDRHSCLSLGAKGTRRTSAVETRPDRRRALNGGQAFLPVTRGGRAASNVGYRNASRSAACVRAVEGVATVGTRVARRSFEVPLPSRVTGKNACPPIEVARRSGRGFDRRLFTP